MISASDFRKGVTFEINGEPHVVLDFMHVKPGKGAAFVRTKYKNIITGAIREEAFNPDDRFKKAHIDTKKMQYLYNDGEFYYFMDPETFDQIPLAYEIVEDASMAGLVAEDFGIAVMPEIPILKNLNVDVLDIENPPYERYIYLAKLKEKYLAPVVKEFIEYVKERDGKAL